MTVQNHKYNFSIKREKRKLACFSEREKNRPKVNGKEFDGMHGLNTYDYGASSTILSQEDGIGWIR